MIFFTKNNNFTWLALDIDENGKVNTIKCADYITDQALPSDWKTIPKDQWPRASSVFDPDDGMQLLLHIDAEGIARRILLRKFGLSVIAMNAEYRKENMWIKVSDNDPFIATLREIKQSALEICPLNDGQKEEIKNIYKAAQPRTWDNEKKLEVDDLLFDRESKLTVLQQKLVNEILILNLAGLKEQSQSADEYVDALTAVIRGALDDNAQNRLRELTFANALALRSSCVASVINASIQPRAFYAERKNNAALSITIADVREYMFRVLSREWQRHNITIATINLPKRVASEEVEVGSLTADGHLAHYYLGLTVSNSNTFILLCRSLEEGLHSLTLDEINTIDRFIDAGIAERELPGHREVIDDLIAVQGANNFYNNMTALKREIASVRDVRDMLIRLTDRISDNEMNRKINTISTLRYAILYISQFTNTEERVIKASLIMPFMRILENYVRVFATLNEGQQNAMLSMFPLTDIRIGKSVFNDIRQVTAHELNEFLRVYPLDTLVKEFDDLLALLGGKLPQQQKVILQKVNLRSILKMNRQLNELLYALPDELYDMVLVALPLDALILSGEHLVATLLHFNVQQRRVLLNKVSLNKIINSPGQLCRLLCVLNADEMEYVFSTISTNVINHPDTVIKALALLAVKRIDEDIFKMLINEIINNVADLVSIINFLNKKQTDLLFANISLDDIIKSPQYLIQIFKLHKHKSINKQQLCSVLKNVNLSKAIGSAANLIKLLGKFTTNEQDIFLQAADLNSVITNTQDIIKVLKCLFSQQQIALCNAVSLKSIIKNLDDFHAVLRVIDNKSDFPASNLFADFLQRVSSGGLFKTPIESSVPAGESNWTLVKR